MTTLRSHGDARVPVGGAALVRAGGERIDLARVARAGRGLLIVAPGWRAAVASVAEPWSDRIDTVAAEISCDGLDGLLLRPDGHAIWVGRGGASSGERDALRAAAERWFGAPATG